MFPLRRFQWQITQLISGEKRIGSNLICERQLRHFIILEPWERECQTRGKVYQNKKKEVLELSLLMKMNKIGRRHLSKNDSMWNYHVLNTNLSPLSIQMLLISGKFLKFAVGHMVF